MKKILRISVTALCALLLMLVPARVFASETDATAVRYDPYEEGIISSYYSVDRERGFLTGIAPGTTVQQLQNVCLPADTTLSREILTTGTVLTAQVPSADPAQPAAEHALTLIVTGDLNGDGNVTITDMLMLKNKILGQNLEAPAEAAGDINYDGNVTITDFLRIKSVLLGKDQIAAGGTPNTQMADNLLLLTPGEVTAWIPTAEATATVSENEVLISVNPDGTVTAGDQEGTTFLYALDGEGRIIDRTLVTILQEKLAPTLDAAEYPLLTGQTQKATVRFNHPLTPTVTWATSDPAVATVDSEGNITACSPGTATLTASLTNGSTAQATIVVIPPITALEMGRDLYKVKPGATRQLELLPTPADVQEIFTWTTSDPAIVTVDQNGVVTGVNYGTATITATGKYSGLSVSCQVKICNVKQIAFTFDDGPSPYTTELLDYLQERGFKVTFFLVGDRLASYPNTLKRQVDEGHEIGYHSYAHVEQTTLSNDKIISDFNKSQQTLKDITGAEFALWRTPGGGYNTRVLNCIDLPHIMWSVDSYDWKVRNTQKVYANIMRQAHDGGIVLLHDLYSFSVNGAKLAMDELWAGDYEFVTVTEILSRDGTPPEPNTNYFNG